MPGLLELTLPSAFLALLIFHTLVKWPVISLLPRSWQARLVGPAHQFRWLPLTRLFWIVISLAIGIASHVVWDGCTHLEGWCVQAWPALRASVFHLGGSTITVYKLLQHGSTLVGLIVLAVCTGRWYRRATENEVELPPRLSPARRSALAAAFALVAVAAGLLKSASAVPFLHGLSSLQHFVGGFVVTTITVAAAELVVFSLFWRMFLMRDIVRQQERSWR